MTIAFSRRSLLGAASAGTALAFGNAPVLVAAKPAQKPLFGPDQGIAWLTYNENPYGPSPKAFLLVTLAGSFFIDLANAIIVKGFLALLPWLH